MNEGQVIAELYTIVKKLQEEKTQLIRHSQELAKKLEELEKPKGTKSKVSK